MFENSIFKIEFSILLGLFPHHNLYRLTFQSFVLREYDVPFRSYLRKGQRSIFCLYRGQTDKNDLFLLAMVSKCSSGKYNSNSE